MNIGTKREQEMKAEFDRSIAVLKKHLKGISKNDLVRLTIGHMIEIEELKNLLKVYYEKHGAPDEPKGEEKNA